MMLGAIAGDIIGSTFEFSSMKSKSFELFVTGSTPTDDSILTVAIADWVMSGGAAADHLRRYARRYPDAGYGGRFKQWMRDDGAGPYRSYGNGAAMRISAVAYVARSEKQVLALARQSALPTHNHPEGVKGAQAAALAMWMALQGHPASEISERITRRFGYDLSEAVDEIRARYGYDITCQGTVPPALVCAFSATDYEDAVRNAVSLGGDADSLACITGGLAEILYGLPTPIAKRASGFLGDDLRAVVSSFRRRHVAGRGGLWKSAARLFR